jgi:hypothetical protein
MENWMRRRKVGAAFARARLGFSLWLIIQPKKPPLVLVINFTLARSTYEKGSCRRAPLTLSAAFWVEIPRAWQKYFKPSLFALTERATVRLGNSLEKEWKTTTYLTHFAGSWAAVCLFWPMRLSFFARNFAAFIFRVRWWEKESQNEIIRSRRRRRYQMNTRQMLNIGAAGL